MATTILNSHRRIIRNVSVAALGPFKSKGRGQFDQSGLDSVIRAGNAKGEVPCFLQHISLTYDDRSEFFCGMLSNFRYLDSARDAVVADLAISPAAAHGPFDIAAWLVSLSQNDPNGIQTSMVLSISKRVLVDASGKRVTNADGSPVPEAWTCKELHSVDFVRVGDSCKAGAFLRPNATHSDVRAARRRSTMAKEQFYVNAALSGVMRWQPVPKTSTAKTERLIAGLE